jgi:serine/threonine protein kinase/tetratricopeptide (TPR) repeat protein
MEDERWRRIEDLYHLALEQKQEQRTAFLEQACGGDDSLRREVESLISNDGPDTVLDRPAAHQLAEPDATVVGHYRLLQKIGEGGMGEVWLAEQREPVRRRVALKLVKAGMNTREVMTRFESERQALALMDHPGIAKVFDAGAAPQGAPYFAMEYVAGVPITEYCDGHKLSTRERLELFMQVCEAVQHAHRKAIIHRDLKPSNILVMEVDGRAAPKIIDFGVAKALTQRLTADTLFTRAGTMLGTPAYMSPEQARSSGEDIDTRTDVYSLGIVLYELLAGAPPLELHKITLEEFLRRLREEEPPKPSTRIRTRDGGTSMELARKRRLLSKVQSEPLALAKQVRGDLDAITLKALEKDRSRRYGSPSELATDIGRYLSNEAVLAVPPSAAYRARKFVRRHQAGVSLSAAVVVVLCGATASVAWEARIARQERDLAQQRFNDVRGLARQVIFSLQNQLAALPGTTQVRRDIVAVAVNYLDSLARHSSADQGMDSELAAAYLQIGRLQGGGGGTQNLGDRAAALESFAKAERFARAVAARQPSGQAKRLLGDALTAQAYGARESNQLAKGAAKAMEALQVARDRAGSDRSKDAQIQLGAALQCASTFGDTKDRLRYLSEQASLFEDMLAHDPNNPERWRNAALAHKYIAGHLIGSADADGAVVHLKRAQELDEASVRAAPNNPENKMALAIDLGQWGEYYENRDVAKGIQYTQASLAIRREIAAADPKDAWAQEKLAYSLSRLGDLQLNVSAREALASYGEARSIAERLQTESVRAERLAGSISGIGDAYRKLGDVRRSCAAYAESMKLYRELLKSSPIYAEQADATEKAYETCPSANR